MVVIASLPLKPIEDLLLRFRRVAVVAPHPDDETLGCGGAIALFRQNQVSVRVVVVSDGAQSHPNSQQFPPRKLRALREEEALAALKILEVPESHITFLRWPDTAVPQPGQPQFLKAVEDFDRILKPYRPDLLLSPWQFDQHCDHQATWHIVQHCSSAWSPPPTQLAYSIWGDRAAGLRCLPPGEQGWRLDIASVMRLKLDAAMAYRSQTTDLIQDDPNGFRLTAEMLNNLIQPYETYLEVR